MGGEVIPLEELVWLTVGHWWQNRNDIFVSPPPPPDHFRVTSGWTLATLTLNLSVRAEGIYCWWFLELLISKNSLS